MASHHTSPGVPTDHYSSAASLYQSHGISPYISWCSNRSLQQCCIIVSESWHLTIHLLVFQQIITAVLHHCIRVMASHHASPGVLTDHYSSAASLYQSHGISPYISWCSNRSLQQCCIIVSESWHLTIHLLVFQQIITAVLHHCIRVMASHHTSPGVPTDHYSSAASLYQSHGISPYISWCSNRSLQQCCIIVSESWHLTIHLLVFQQIITAVLHHCIRVKASHHTSPGVPTDHYSSAASLYQSHGISPYISWGSNRSLQQCCIIVSESWHLTIHLLVFQQIITAVLHHCIRVMASHHTSPGVPTDHYSSAASLYQSHGISPYISWGSNRSLQQCCIIVSESWHLTIHLLVFQQIITAVLHHGIRVMASHHTSPGVPTDHYSSAASLHQSHGISNHLEVNCFFNILFWLTTKKTTNLCITGPLWGESISDHCIALNTPHKGAVMLKVSWCLMCVNVLTQESYNSGISQFPYSKLANTSPISLHQDSAEIT